MAVFVNDTFTDTSGTALQSHTGETGATWTEHSSYASGGAVISDANRLRSPVAAVNSVFYASGAPFSADYDVEVDVIYKTDVNTFAGVSGRINTAANTYYWARHSASGTHTWQLYKIIAGVATQLGANSNQTLTVDQAYRLKLGMHGSTISLSVDGVDLISVTDTAITAAGKAGIFFFAASGDTTGHHLDNFTATDTNAGPSVGLAGVEGAGSAGSFTINADNTQTLAGVQGDGGVGAFSLIIGQQVTTTGVEGIGSPGTFGISIDSNVTLTGAQGVGAAGIVNTPTTGLTIGESAHPNFQRDPGFTTRDVPFSFSYTGGFPQGLTAVINATGVGTIHSVACTNLQGSGGSGTFIVAAVPSGSKYKATITETFSGVFDAQAAEWGVGVIVAMTGQSLGDQMRTVSSSPPSPHALTYQYRGSYVAPTGNGNIAMANAIRSGLAGTGAGGTDIPVTILAAALDGSGLHGAFSSWRWWMETVAGSPYANFQTWLAGVGGKIESVIWVQGVTDAIIGTTEAEYMADLSTLYDRMITDAGQSASTLSFGVALHATMDDPTATDAMSDAIRQAQLKWVRDTAGAFFAGSLVDIPRSDDYHLSAANYAKVGEERYSKAFLKSIGILAYGADGPKIVRIYGTQGAAKLYFVPEHSGGSGLTELDGGTDGDAVTGLGVSDDNFATTKTIVSTAFVNGEIEVTLSASPENILACRGRYQYGENPSITNPIYDNQVLPSGLHGFPLQPTIGSIVVTEAAGALRDRNYPQGMRRGILRGMTT